MINANELRVGNLVISEAGVVRNVTGHDIKEQWWHEGDPHGSVGASINPIPLTPEWLGRFGFEDIGPYWQYNGEPGFVLLKDKEGVAYIGNPVRTYVKTVHQLQNLYYALTGEELNVKP